MVERTGTITVIPRIFINTEVRKYRREDAPFAGDGILSSHMILWCTGESHWRQPAVTTRERAY